MAEAKRIEINTELLIGALRQKLSERDYENACLMARNTEIELQLKEVLENQLQKVEGEIKKTEAELKSLTEGGKTNGE